jgi:hypothetical protein
MVLIYLDQNKWIDLARADHNHPTGGPFRDTLQVAHRAVAEGKVCFPLSSTHYVETLNTNNTARRRRLASTMGKLSNFRTLLHRGTMHSQELCRALEGDYPILRQSRHPILGYGRGHAFGSFELQAFRVAFRAHFPSAWFAHELEELAGSVLPSWEGPKDIWRSSAQDHVKTTIEVDGLFGRLRASRCEKQAVIRRAEAEQMLASVTKILADCGVTATQWDIERASSLLEGLPLLSATHQLLIALYENPRLPREPNNFADVGAIAHAVVTCDYVVTEKQWVHLGRRAGLEGRFRTRLVADVNELAPLIQRGF